MRMLIVLLLVSCGAKLETVGIPTASASPNPVPIEYDLEME